jgi:hypothetical protein
MYTSRYCIWSVCIAAHVRLRFDLHLRLRLLGYCTYEFKSVTRWLCPADASTRCRQRIDPISSYFIPVLFEVVTRRASLLVEQVRNMTG